MVLDNNLNDELGVVDQIFCDKTGTLTRNILDLKVCTIGSEIYGDLSFVSQKHLPKHWLSKRIGEGLGQNYAQDTKSVI